MPGWFTTSDFVCLLQGAFERILYRMPISWIKPALMPTAIALIAKQNPTQ